MVQDVVVFEWKFFRVRFEEKIERIEHGHLGNQIHFHTKFLRLFLENQTREVVGLRVLLPVNEMFFWLNAKGIAQNPRPRMRRGAQPDILRAGAQKPVLFIMRPVTEGYVNGHDYFVYKNASTGSTPGVPRNFSR